MTGEAWCTHERQRDFRTGRVVVEIWHAILGATERPDPDAADFDPIACSTTGEGIVYPGRREWRAPTCPGCLTVGP